jgi:hypothetical protein
MKTAGPPRFWARVTGKPEVTVETSDFTQNPAATLHE